MRRLDVEKMNRSMEREQKFGEVIRFLDDTMRLVGWGTVALIAVTIIWQVIK